MSELTGKEAFFAYFATNYPAGSQIYFANPAWHAEKLYSVAVRCFLDEKQEQEEQKSAEQLMERQLGQRAPAAAPRTE